MQVDLKHIDFRSLSRAMVSYIKAPTRKPVKDLKTGFFVTDKKGRLTYELEKGGKKIGVMVAGIHPNKNYKIVVGFSMCCKKDRYNWINTSRGCIKVEGFGKKIATKRAIKWEEFDLVWTGKVPKEMTDLSRIVVIPESIYEHLIKFLVRCKTYYKDKEFPLWVDALVTVTSEEVKKA